MAHLERFNILTEKQHGFRAHHSCETQLIQTVHDLALSLQNKQQTDLIIMDFSKAFDTVPHNRLLHKLTQYGITGNIHQWLSSFLTQRRQRVILGGESSSWVKVRSGVPQGTVVGPLLFLIYLNDLPQGISSSIRLFADDCVVYRNITCLKDTAKLQEDMKVLDKWQHSWQMSFNIEKCFLLRITHKTNPVAADYTLGGSVLKQLKIHTYLGVEITEDLKWNTHVSKLTAKANRALGFIRRNLPSCPRNLKAQAYGRMSWTAPSNMVELFHGSAFLMCFTIF